MISTSAKEDLIEAVIPLMIGAGVSSGIALARRWKAIYDEPQYKKKYFPKIKAIIKPLHIPFAHALALIQTESGWKPLAHRPEPAYFRKYLEGKQPWVNNRWYPDIDIISSSYGLTQIMYPTAVQLGFPQDVNPEELYDVDVNLKFGLAYYAQNRVMGDTIESYIHYNAGPGFTFNTASIQAQENAIKFKSNLADFNEKLGS